MNQHETVSTTPRVLGLQPSFGFGDRLGLATSGHIDALREADGAIKGIFAQQSIREMNRTNRSAEDVMHDAAEAIRTAGFSGEWGADADHLKTPEDVRTTAEAGFVFYTIDPSDAVDQQADDYDRQTLAERFAAIQDQLDWIDEYRDRTVTLDDGSAIAFDDSTVQRAAVKYGPAITHALQLGVCIREEATRRGQPFEIELSVDETEQPTSPAEHCIIAEQCRKHGLKLVSLAPRFPGELEKAVDYKGDLAALEKSLETHAAIARQFGPYKLSLHSGSDKLSMYPLLARATQGRFHVKTAGTSYLEALRVVARLKPAAFQELVAFARDHYETDKATYHVSATLDGVPPPEDIADEKQLERLYLECWEDVPEGQGFTAPGRQILHCTFGSVLTDAKWGPFVRQVLGENSDVYRRVLCEHFSRHLRAVQNGL